MNIRLSSSQSAVVEIGIMFLPAIPAYLWLWPNVDGTDWFMLAQSAVYVYFIACTLFIRQPIHLWKAPACEQVVPQTLKEWRAKHMKSHEADELGMRIAALVQAGQITQAYTLLAPVLAERTPFRLLGRVGEAVGVEPVPAVNAFLTRVAADKTEGGWVVIGSALGKQLNRDPVGAFDRCRMCIIAGDVWYVPDILGERVPGPALLTDFPRALRLLSPWRDDANHWVRRTVGIAIHFWAKRARSAPEYAAQAKALLRFMEPMFEEQDKDAVKGLGWGLKTLGKYYPKLATGWLSKQIAARRGRYRALMLRKALTYLPAEQRARVMKALS